MLRVGFLTLATAAVAMLAAAQSHAEEVLRATTMLPRTLIYSESFLKFVEKVNQEAAGTIRIDFIGGPEAIPTPEQPEALRNGVIDMVYGPATYYLGMVPEVDALLGSNIEPPEQRANGGMELLNEIHQSRLNAFLLAHPDAGHGFHIYLSELPEINADGMPDLSGRRIRGAQLYREFFQGLGATYVSIKVPEVYTALERGTVAGVGWPSVGMMDLSWDNFLKVRIDPAYFQTEVVILVNLDRWNAMSEVARNALQALAIEHETDSMVSFQTMERDEDAEMRRRGVEVVTLDEAAAARYRSAAIETAWMRLKTRNATHHDALRDKFYRQ